MRVVKQRFKARYGLSLMLALAVSSVLIAGAVERSKQDGWILHQHCDPLGDQVVYVSPQGVKAVSPKSGLSILALPPFKQFVIYNLKTSKVYRIQSSHFRHPMERTFSAVNGFSLDIIPLVKDKDRDTSFAGVHSAQYKAPATFADSQKARFKAKEFPSRSPQTIEFAASTDISDNPDLSNLLCLWFCLPTVRGVPLSFRFRDMDRDLHEYLTTQSCERAAIKATDFVLPTTLKTASSAQDVYMGRVYDQEAVQMMFGGEGHK
jgi:hypothetical protein